MAKTALFCSILCIMSSVVYAAEIKATANPGPRAYSSMITDTLNDRIILFGGGDYRLPWGEYFNDVWSLDVNTETWELLNLQNPLPAGRIWSCAAYHPAIGKMYLFGGRDASTMCTDVWELNLVAGAEDWTQLSPSGTPPAPRTSASAIIDPLNNRLIIFGGEDGSSSNNQTWALNLNTVTWTQLNPSGTLPSARYGHVAVYDPVAHQMIVFGGLAGSSTRNDAWALDLTYGSETWHQIFPSGTLPGPRVRQWGAYDSYNNDLVTGFGYDYPGYYLFYNDIWRLDLTDLTWQQIFPGGISVEGRRGSNAAFDHVFHRIFIFGGDHGYDYYLGDTYVLTLDTLAVEEFNAKILPHLEIYPNPFKLPCRLNAFMPGNGHARLQVFDLTGRVVKNLIADTRYSGNYFVEWDGKDENGKAVSTGTYFIRLEMNGKQSIKKTVVIEN